MLDTATTTPAADRAALLVALAALGNTLSTLHDDAQRLAMPQAVVMGLMWLRDDAAGLLIDALAAKEPAL